MAVTVAKDKDFGKTVLERDGLVVTVVTSAACQESLRLVPVLEEMEKAYKGRVNFVNLDLGDDEATARSSKMARRYKLTRLPVIAVFKDGVLKDFIGGVPSADNVREMIDSHMKPVGNVGEHNFQREVLESKVPVLVHFTAAACRESQAMVPVLEETARKFADRAKVVTIEADAFNAGLAARYGATRFPMVAVFEAGEMRDCVMGVVSDDVLRSVGADNNAVDHMSGLLEPWM